jgi:hypothetical protein
MSCNISNIRNHEEAHKAARHNATQTKNKNQNWRNSPGRKTRKQIKYSYKNNSTTLLNEYAVKIIGINETLLVFLYGKYKSMKFKNRPTKEKRHIHIIFTENVKKLHTFYERCELIKESISRFKVHCTLSLSLLI